MFLLSICVAPKRNDELTSRFLSHGVMDALGVVYPQYWVHGDCDASFREHLDVLKDFYWEPKWIGTCDDKKSFHQSLTNSKRSPSNDYLNLLWNLMPKQPWTTPNWKPSEELCESISKNWRTFDTNLSLTKTFGEYIILVEIAMTLCARFG